MILQQKQRRRLSIRKEYLEQNRLRVSFERKLRLQMLTLFADIGNKASNEYRGLGRLLNTSRQMGEDLSKLLQSHYRAVINEFGLRIIRQQKQEPQFDQIIKEYFRLYGAIRVTQISDTTMRQLSAIISAGLADGLSVSVIAANIFDSMRGSFTKYRAATIARTETHSAASFANHAVNASLKIPDQKKRWVAVADDRARSWHTQMNGTEVDLRDDFIVNVKGQQFRMGYTGDPRGGALNTINCRCVTLYFTDEDELEE